MIDLTNPTINTVIRSFPRVFLGNTISSAISDDATRAVIKVPDADSAFRNDMQGHAGVVQVYTKFDHRELLEILYRGANWTNRFPTD